MKLLFFIMVSVFVFCEKNFAAGLNAKFKLNKEEKSFYHILATNGREGVLELVLGKFKCFGQFKMNQSYGNIDDPGHINIFFPSIQNSYPGNCHNFSLSIDLKGISPWNLKKGEELETSFKGVSTFGFERGTILIAI